jgi:hypothetical protein
MVHPALATVRSGISINRSPFSGIFELRLYEVLVKFTARIARYDCFQWEQSTIQTGGTAWRPLI